MAKTEECRLPIGIEFKLLKELFPNLIDKVLRIIDKIEKSISDGTYTAKGKGHIEGWKEKKQKIMDIKRVQCDN